MADRSERDAGAASTPAPVNAAVTGRGPLTGRLDDTLSGHLLDRSHTTAPYDLGRMILEEVTAVGVRDFAVWLQDYDQRQLHPLPLPGSHAAVEAVDGSLPGRAYTLQSMVEHDEPGGARRLWVPLLDGTERVGVVALTIDEVDDDVRAYVRRLAGNIAHLFFSKGMYTDDYQRVRRRQDLTLAAEMQWNMLPPLTISTPEISIAGLLEPAYHIAGDSFDYALNSEGLHFAIVDAMGHGLSSAIMANTVMSAYRHARRLALPLNEMYHAVDTVMAQQFGEDTFATAQFATIDVQTGLLSWVNAGHPPPILVRGRKAVRSLAAEPHLPVGFGAAPAAITTEQLEPGDRLLFFTDGVVEHRNAAGEMFGEERLAERLLRHLNEQLPAAEVLRRLNRDLLELVGPDGPGDDATIVLVHWPGASAEISGVPAEDASATSVAHGRPADPYAAQDDTSS